MNFKALIIAAIGSIANVAFPIVVSSEPATSIERINLEVSAPQNIWKNNSQAEDNNRSDRIEANSPEANAESSQPSETFELEQAEGNCHTRRTNQSVDRKTFEGYCDWDWKF